MSHRASESFPPETATRTRSSGPNIWKAAIARLTCSRTCRTKQSWQKAALCRRSSTTAGALQRRHFMPDPPLITGRISISSASSSRSSRVRSSRSRITSTVSGLMPSSPRTWWTLRPPAISTLRSGLRSLTFIEAKASAPPPASDRALARRHGVHAEREGEHDPAAGPTDHHDLDPVSRAARTDRRSERIRGRDGFPVEGDDDVADPDPRAVGGPILDDVHDRRSLVDLRVELELHLRVVRIGRPDPHEGDRLVRVVGRLEDGWLHGVDLDREPYVLGRGGAGRVDAHDSARQVDEGSAGVPRVDGRIGLDHIGVDALAALALLAVRIGDRDPPGERRDDPGRDRGATLEAERVPDRNDPLAELERRRAAQRHRGQALRLDVQHREVRLDVAPDHPRGQLPRLLLGGDDGDPRGALDDVVVRDHDAVRTDEEPRTLATAAP